MQPAPPLLLTLEGGRARIVLNRPEAHNALSPPLVEALHGALDAIEAAPGLRVVTIEGAGPSFCAGADLKFFLGALEDEVLLAGFLGDLRRAMTRLEALPLPVLAVLHGFVLAGGLELMLACDLAIAAEDAVLGDQHINFALIPGGGGTQRLPRLIGQRRARELMFTGARVDGRRAEAIGLVNQAVPGGQLEQAAARWVETLSGKTPVGLARIKQLATLAADSALEAGLDAEAEVFAAHTRHPHLHEGLRAFVEKRPPHFTEEPAGDGKPPQHRKKK